MNHKFRALGRDDEKFYFGSVCYNIDGFPILLIPQKNGTMNRIFIHPETVGMFTGLKDSKGVEIYEGDIAQYENKDGVHIGVVKWINGYSAFRLVFSDGTWTDLENITIIGNIHENPNLLEQAQDES